MGLASSPSVRGTRGLRPSYAYARERGRRAAVPGVGEASFPHDLPSADPYSVRAISMLLRWRQGREQPTARGSPFGKRRREEPIEPRPRPWRRAASFLEGAWLAGGAQILSSCDSVKTDVPDRARPRPGPITRDDREGMDTHPRPSRLRPPNASQGAGEAPEISSESDEEDASRWEPHGETRIPLTAPVGRSESYTVKPVPTAARRSCNGDNHA